jgi:chemotaxis protein MotB
MAKKKKGGGHAAGGHGWFVTFADLMGLLVAFFVMLVAFSSQDSGKLQVVAGSMRDAFGVQPLTRYSGIIEIDGIPTRPRLKNAKRISPDESSANPSPDDKSRNFNRGTALDNVAAFALASASLRQALSEMPDLLEVSKHIVIEETKDGLNIEIVDQDGRSMFPEGQKEPYERTRRLIQRLASQFKIMPYRMTIVGHTSAAKTSGRPDYGPWDLSADRANVVRQILEGEGVPENRIFMVAGKADTQPLFPDDPSIASNRRVTITLMHEAPALPANFRP